MKKFFLFLVFALMAQVGVADVVIASYTFPDQDLKPSGTYTGTISETLGTVSGCTVYCEKIGGYQSNGTTPNSAVLNATTYFQKFSGDNSYITITLTGGGKIQEGDVFKATLFSGSTSTDGFYFKARTTGNYQTIKYSSTAAVTLEYQLKAADINDDGSLTIYRYSGACYVNTISVERASGEQVDFLSTNFNDGTWGEILSENPTSGSFGSSERNGFVLTSAAMRNGTVKLAGPTALSDNDINFTNRIIVDKNTSSYVVTPYVANCNTLRIVANSGSDDKSFNVYKQIGTGLWSPVAEAQASSKTPTLYSFPINSNSPVRFRIENNTTSSLFISYIGTDPESFPLTIASVGYATFSSAAQYQAPADVTVYYAESQSAGIVTLKSIDSRIIPAKTGVVLYKNGGGNVSFTSNSEAAEPIGTNLMQPNLTAATLAATSGDYTNFILGVDGTTAKFVKSSGKGTLAANKAYLRLPTAALSAHELTIAFADDNVTGIETVNGSHKVNDVRCYNLAGQQVTTPVKGIYVINGKKVVVK